MDLQPIPGISVGFLLEFLVPLSLAVLVCVLIAKPTNVKRFAWGLTILWLIACFPAGFLIWMGYAFEKSDDVHPAIQIPIWVVLGLGIIWFPLLRKATKKHD